MQSSVFRKVEKDFDLKRQNAQNIAKEFKKNVYDKNPRLAEIEEEINTIAIKSAKSRIFSDEISRRKAQEKLEIEIGKLNLEYNDVLSKIGLTKWDFEPKYECEKCKDTGYVNGTICSCFNQQLIDESYKQSNLSKIKDENFETFDYGYYSTNNDREKYGLMVFLSSCCIHEYEEKLIEYKDEFVKVINKDYKEESDNTIRKIEDPFLNAVHNLCNSIEVTRLLNDKNDQFKQELKDLMDSYMDELNKELNKDYENANNLVNKNTIIENYMIKLIHLCDEYGLNANNDMSYNETLNEYKYVLKNMY